MLFFCERFILTSDIREMMRSEDLTVMNLEELQRELDADKWYESEKAGRDVCGEFPYCRRCVKGIEFPCATAYTAFYAKDEKPVPASKTLEKQGKRKAVK